MIGTDLIIQEHGDVIDAIRMLELQKKEIEAKEKLLREALQQAMEDHKVFWLDLPGLSITYVDAFDRDGIDTARLKKELPAVAAEYRKTAHVNASIRIKAKEVDGNE